MAILSNQDKPHRVSPQQRKVGHQPSRSHRKVFLFHIFKTVRLMEVENSNFQTLDEVRSALYDHFGIALVQSSHSMSQIDVNLETSASIVFVSRIEHQSW